MPVTTMPAIDVANTSGWTENQIDMYNALPFYFAKVQAERMQTWGMWDKFVGKRKWKSQQGDTMRTIRTEPSPHKRQMAIPSPLSQVPKKDIMNVAETTVDAQVYRHRFESPNLYFFPDFNDFMSHVDDTSNDIMEKIERYNDLFLRTMIFHMSPVVAVMKAGGGVEIINTPFFSGTGTFTEGTSGKTATYLKENVFPLVTGGLQMASLNKLHNIAETQRRIPYFTGSAGSGVDSFLQGKYCATLSTEAYNNWTFDPFVKENKSINMDLVNGSFRGILFGRMTTRIEDLPLRFKMDGTYADPELRVEDADAYNPGETVPNEQYTLPANSPIETGFFVGGQGYEAIEVGPPSSKFTGDTPPHDFPAMFWNGEVKATKQFLIKAVDNDGNEVYEMNTYGEWMRLISQTVHGIVPKQRRNIIPMLYVRS